MPLRLFWDAYYRNSVRWSLYFTYIFNLLRWKKTSIQDTLHTEILPVISLAEDPFHLLSCKQHWSNVSFWQCLYYLSCSTSEPTDIPRYNLNISDKTSSGSFILPLGCCTDFHITNKKLKSFINFKTMDFKWSKTLNSRTAILLLTSTQQEGSGCFYRDTIFRTNSVIHPTQWEPPNSLISFTRKQVIKCSLKPTRDYIFFTRQYSFTLTPESLQLPPWVTGGNKQGHWVWLAIVRTSPPPFLKGENFLEMAIMRGMANFLLEMGGGVLLDLLMSSLGTLVPEGPWCVFYTTRHQVYWGLTHSVVFNCTLIWYHTHEHTNTHTHSTLRGQ